MDKTWDSAMATLSISYARTLDLLAGNEFDEATKEFQDRFSPAVEGLYKEAAKTYPPRFSRIGNWCIWIDKFRGTTRLAKTALSNGKPNDASRHLEAIRTHFLNLHRETRRVNASDFIYSFQRSTAVKNPKVKSLVTYYKTLATAKPSIKMRAQKEEYEAARAKWSRVVAPILQDGELTADEIGPLRESTEAFHQAFGRTLE